ncbi:MAG TPA: prephenate dehydrogenase/arogenate dehydrogenase family protein [Solirubrobacteraceae bacterium]|nr:prephenate dehydrogenase/arogenate dehydrogenase family protein [Solirubrobacteraceae bacterium]
MSERLTVAVIGTGLIGGSVGMAARRRLGARVRGTGRRAPQGVELGALDQACADAGTALDGADVAVVCAPVDVLPEVTRDVLAAAPQACAVTDVGSTKRGVVAAAGGDERFVGGHPLAGAEVSGVEHAREDLFDGATWYLTPQPTTSGVLLERVHRLLTGIGARPHVVDPADHDRMMAAVSHLPHVLANALVAQAAGALGGERMPATGPSFRDATRVAGANPDIWTGIYRANSDALMGELDGTIEHLQAVRAALAADDAQALERWQREAGERRRALLEAGLAGGPVRELRAAVPNRPGVIADIALTLGREGVNITDMALSPSPDNSSGVVALWVPEGHADRAIGLIAGLGIPVS